MRHLRPNTAQRLMCGAAAIAILSFAGAAQAEERAFTIEPQALSTALAAFGAQSGHPVMAPMDLLGAKVTRGFSQAAEPEVALAQLLDGTGLTYRKTGDTFAIVSASDPQSGSAAGDGAEGTVQALIVTAQKREENIQDVPIAMSAFTQEDLTRSQVAGGPDLMTQVPNMTFTKTNFSSYSIQLRGIGTQAISATVDPAVAVAFNNTPFIRNRFFEQEFYDLQRIEVLRGPQGTLYGRNATAGVVNLLSAKPKFTYEAKVAADVANYGSTRIEGMLNIPLAEDMAALRIAGAWTKREGYSTNDFNGNPIDGRDLWSTRVSLRLAPSNAVDINLIWEHFQENDDRLRSGKQLCKTDVVTSVAGIPTPNFYQTLPELGQPLIFAGVQGSFSQGCMPASLYSPDSFQKTNAIALPYYIPLGAVQLPIPFINGLPADPYASRELSPDLRSVEAVVDPSYRAKTDVVELQFKADLTDHLTLNSETGWSSDFIFSTQDYNRFIGAPHAWTTEGAGPQRMVERGILSDDGVFCDPQIGCSDRLVAMDLSTAKSAQFSQELRLASDFDGPFNFSLGANFLRYDTEDKYYVFINSLSLISAYFRNESGFEDHTPYIPNQTDNRDCLPNGLIEPDFSKAQSILICTYIDPNPISNLNDLGHNYFLSKNPYKLISYAVFGEGYYDLTDNLKVTAGLRWTVDKKEAPLIPSWVLATNTAGYPIVETVKQEWRKPTGRLALDWKPDLGFTDQTMVYGSYSRGYKAGGMNPPPYGKAFYGAFGDLALKLAASSALHPKTFEPEYVNALELGTKNTLLDGTLTLNLAGFHYDYKGYQLSQIIDRSAVTLNFDAKVWGLELESDWRPLENLKLGLKLGYEKTRVADGMQAIDVMDRTAGAKGWVLNKPFPAIPSNCVLPEWLFLGQNGLVNVGGKGGGSAGGCELAYILGYDPATANPFSINPGGSGGALRGNVNYASLGSSQADFPCWPQNVPFVGVQHYPGVDPECLAALSNNGEGFFKQLGGKELPNAPHMTATLTADYTIPLPSDWLMTFHTDLYYQSEAWTRIFNTEGYDKLKAYTNVNLAAIFTNEDAGWKVMAYVKNVFDRDSITGAFLNSDDTGLTTNIFLTEPRLYGLRVTKDFAGGPWWTGGNLNHEGPYPLTIELGGQIQRHDAPNEQLVTSWAQSLPANVALADVQDRKLDWGDGRSLKITYKPDGSPWSVSGTVRYGRTNNGTTRVSNDSADTIAACGATPGNFFYDFICGPGASSYYESFRNIQVVSWSDAEAHSREEHQIIDFAVGHDVGVGGLQSTLSVAVRYADFDSNTQWAGNAQADWNVPDGWACFGGLGSPYCAPVSYRRHHATLTASRKFTGAGPMGSWDAAVGLWNGERYGKVRLETSLNAGVLYGEKTTVVSGSQVSILHEGQLNYFIENFPFSQYSTVQGALPEVGDTTPTPVSIRRTERASVPMLDLSLGLSYDVGRVKIGGGYRWERYFDVLDTGFENAKDADRTIDGPYLKIAVGFGG